MTVLITGIAGFVGGHLVDLLRAEHPEEGIAGVVRPGTPTPDPLREGVRLLEADLEDAAAVESAVAAVRPDSIIHLAGQSSVHESWSNPAATIRTNVIGLLNVFEAVRRRRLEPRVLVVGSAEEYGSVEPDAPPLTEDAPLRPLSPYAVSKVAQDYLGYQYFQSYGLKAVRTRGFNHTGPRRGQVFVTSNFCSQVAAIELGLQEPVIRVGNIDAIRDFTDVRDMVRAYWLAVTKAKPGEVYNIATGHGISIRDMLNLVLSNSKVEVKIEVDPERLRPSDVEILIGDSTKFRADTGWEPRIPFEQTVSDLLDYWRRTLTVRKQVHGTA